MFIVTHLKSKRCGGGYWSTKVSHNLIGKFVVLGVAAIWDARKGLDDFVELNKCLNGDYQIMLIGLNKPQMDRLPGNIICIEKTDSVAELAELYSIADVFINPTYEDNYPTTNLEAISCGTPVITYETGGSPESAKMYGTAVERAHIDQVIYAINRVDKFINSAEGIDKINVMESYKKLYGF